ncbi:MAG: branched-chain amino acid transport system permease protein [Gaiellaceae bacterium]|jgi:branched-chain amino acid transport system permease protein|nr:branched-chain amino acid transport system permease protein [Gaiellaceae bacterium]
MRRSVLELGAPVLLVVVTALITGAFSRAHQLEFKNALVMTAIVVALYVFVGNSGVISFGHMSFVAVGMYLGGILTVDPETKTFTMPGLFPFLRHTHIGVVPSLAFAALAGGLYGLAVGLPLMRLSGLPAGIATFAVLGITADVLYYWQKVGPTAQTLSDIPETGRWTLGVATIIAITVAYAYQRSRFGRMLRATREDPAAARATGISIYRQRLVAFTLSGALAGLAGGLYVHQLGLIAPDLTYLDLTFVTLAMLVFGGVASLWGAVLGALAISALNSFLGDAENTVHIGFRLTLPAGTRLVTIGAVMALVIILRPSGLTGGREFGWGRR